MIHPVLSVLCALPLLAAAPLCPTPTLTAAKAADLQFGTFTAGPTGGNVNLDPLGTLQCTGDLKATAASSGPAVFTLTGPPRAAFTWDVSPDIVPLGNGRGVNVFSFLGASRTGSFTFDAKGQVQLQIGATLGVAPMCPPGTYRRDQLVLRVTVPGSGATCRVSFAVLAGVMTPLSIRETAFLNFGTITAQSKRFTVKVTPARQRSLPGGEAWSPGAFLVTGQPGAMISLSLPRAAIALKGRGADLFLTDLSADLPGTFALGGSGRADFHVGGTLTVNANQASGKYTGQYPVTVNYLF